MKDANGVSRYGVFTILGIGLLTGTVVLNSASACGINWQKINLNNLNPQFAYITSVTYGGGQFVATVGTLPGGFLTSPDGINWTWIQFPISRTVFADVVWGGNQFVAVGSQNGFYPMVQTSPNGVTWTSHNPPWDNSSKLFGVA